MEIHPLFIHFPIALLIIYALMEMIRFKKLTENESWNYAKAGILIVGVLSAFLALATGDGAEAALRAENDTLNLAVAEVHSTFAAISTTIFAILAVAYIIKIANKSWLSNNQGKTWGALLKVQSFILSTPVSMILAFAGLVTMTITGALGGAMVYSPDVDPVVNFVYHLFF